jgi:rubrerythrin
LRLGVNDEKSGVALYTTLAARTLTPELQTLFTDLADQERFHQRRFEEMLSSLDGAPAGAPSEAERNYLQALTSLLAFPDEDSARRLAGQTVDDAAALDLAATFERDTLLLMQEMKQLVPRADHGVVEQLIDEERAHVVALTQAVRRLAGSA